MRKWFSGLFMKPLFLVKRHVPYKDKEHIFVPYLEHVLKIDPSYKPNYRRARPVRTSGFRSISKYDRLPLNYSSESWDFAVDALEKHFLPFMGGSRVLSIEQVLPEMDLGTSPGYPWNLRYQTKREFLSSSDSDVLLEAWNELSERSVPFLWTEFQKVEIRSVEKLSDVDGPKIRTVLCAPTEHAVLLNRLCLDQNARFYNTNNKHWSFVGSSKFYRGWDRLYRDLSGFQDYWEFDESDFDASLAPFMLKTVCDFRIRCLSPDQRTDANIARMNNLYASIIETDVVLENGHVYRKHTGNPSGSSNTIVDNTLIHFCLLAYAWHRGASRKFADANAYSRRVASGLVGSRPLNNPVFGSYNDFMTHVKARLNGDDNLMGVSPACTGWFGFPLIEQEWGSLGVKTNSPSPVPRPLFENSFLSHNFGVRNGVVLPVPERNKVRDSLIFGSGSDHPLMHLYRLLALRIEAWPDPALFSELDDFLTEYVSANKLELGGSYKDFTFSSVWNSYKTPRQIEELYTGVECPYRLEHQSRSQDVIAAPGLKMVRRTRNQKRNRIRTRNNAQTPALLPPPPPPAPAPRQRVSPPLRRGQKRKRAQVSGYEIHPRRGLTKAGMNFLKCAFAPPDFQTDPGQGIPDEYNGKTLMRKDNFTGTIGGVAGQVQYFLKVPIPGVAYLHFTGTDLPTSSTAWNVVVYPGYEGTTGLAGASSFWSCNNVNAFRYASSNFGIYPTSSYNNTSGSITVWKFPLAATEQANNTGLYAQILNGLESTSRVPPENYAQALYNGVFTSAFNRQPDFRFAPIREGVTNVPDFSGTSMFGSINFSGATNLGYGGCGSMDAIMIAVTNGAGSNNSFILKAWDCLEYQVATSSVLFPYATVSPPIDSVALELYREISAKIPIAVIAAENANMWQRVLGIIRGVAGAASFIPGPIGTIGSGVGAVASGLQALSMD